MGGLVGPRASAGFFTRLNPMSGEPTPPLPSRERAGVRGDRGTGWGVSPLTPTLSRKGRGGEARISVRSYPMSGEPAPPLPSRERAGVRGYRGTGRGVSPLTPTLSRKGRGGGAEISVRCHPMSGEKRPPRHSLPTGPVPQEKHTRQHPMHRENPSLGGTPPNIRVCIPGRSVLEARPSLPDATASRPAMPTARPCLQGRRGINPDQGPTSAEGSIHAAI